MNLKMIFVLVTFKITTKDKATEHAAVIQTLYVVDTEHITHRLGVVSIVTDKFVVFK